MASKARVQKRLYYKIGEACKALGIQPYVLRYWETEFPALTPSKSRSGQRVYSEKELEIIRRIKELLYEEGYTIAGAKKKLEGEIASGALGEPEGEGAESEEEAAAAPPAQATLPVIAPEPVPEPPVPGPPAAAELDTDAAERVQRLLSGIEETLQEAREILTLLGPKSP
ncbi:MAG TPA: MerR family transcriptional regulator [Thermoanaerobaculia bacterium]|jgi:DNA-binding transcriptional MerR regulator|nr:MerR family transcriptional regulator [Thermoanaerobaculia bacterium]